MNRNAPENDFAIDLKRFAKGSRIEARIAAPGQTLLNRESGDSDKFSLPEDGYFQLLPIGEFPGTMIAGEEKVEITQIYDRENLGAMAEGFEGELMVDYEHFSHDLEKATNAAAWITALQLRDDGLYAKARWTGKGRSDVEGGDYRYISPELDQLEVVGKGRMRPRRLTGAGLTNRPAIKSLKPLSNREGFTPTNQDQDMSKIIAAIAPFLALSADADEATVLNRLGNIPEGTTLDQLLAKDTELADIRNRHQELETAHEALLEEQVEADLDLFESEGVIHDRESVKAMLLHNRESTLKMLKGLKAPTQKAPERVYNRATAKPPQNSVEDINAEHDKAEAARAAKIRNRATQIQRDSKVGFHVAWAQAEQEIPAESEAK